VKNHILPTTVAAATQRKRSDNRSQREPKATTGRAFCPTYTTPGLIFPVALRNNAEKPQHPQTHQVAVAAESTWVQEKASASSQQKETGQSVLAPGVNSESLDNVYRVITAVQQIMTDQEKILAITNIVIRINVFFWTVSIVLDSIKLGYHYVSETGSVSILRCIKLWGGGKVKR
jgi:hypothetical protein